MEKKYKAVIFDLDGTLLDTLADLTAAANYIMKKYGYEEKTQKQVRSFMGNGIKRLMELSLPQDLTEERFNEISCDFREYYTEHCRVFTKPYEGIEALLKKLQEKQIRMAIVSNKNDAAVKELAEYYFSDVIRVAIGEKETLRKKPFPDTANEAIRLLGVTPAESLYVGDSEVDSSTAQNAGTDCVLVDWGFRDREDLKKLPAKAVISSPVELLEYFQC